MKTRVERAVTNATQMIVCIVNVFFLFFLVAVGYSASLPPMQSHSYMVY